ncbi:hypothetical protein DUNSADRAFT_18548 [Dunaliella salina]|uniref:Uncharacterized protein n=1 Tax=Dunaliella salina TaxID=3046 RepID=A0ABQ7FZX6_DUNSA|nr:hypothetical protein DUNSADRAFT_18548 [Dunaliella salina]|eukprot:KAF5827900.1 hypothetical protein DUNSADRAFT_18548 [Dunaliella salina]
MVSAGLHQLLGQQGGSLNVSSAAASVAQSLLTSPTSLACVVGAGAALTSKRVRADASALPFQSFGGASETSTSPHTEEPSTQEPSELKSIISVFHPWNLLGITARSIGFSCLLRINVYILELLDHEQSALDAEARGEEPTKAPPLPDLRGQVAVGVRAAVREIAVRFVRRIYEHLAVWQLGTARAAPFLRDGVLWVHHVLHPKYMFASKSQRLFSFGFAMLHANALLYAADCTVAVVQHTVWVTKEQHRSRRKKALSILAGAGFHVGRCLFVLGTTSLVASLATLAKPGIGTRAGWFISDFISNQQMFIFQKSLAL